MAMAVPFLLLCSSRFRFYRAYEILSICIKEERCLSKKDLFLFCQSVSLTQYVVLPIHLSVSLSVYSS